LIFFFNLTFHFFVSELKICWLENKRISVAIPFEGGGGGDRMRHTQTGNADKIIIQSPPLPRLKNIFHSGGIASQKKEYIFSFQSTLLVLPKLKECSQLLRIVFLR